MRLINADKLKQHYAWWNNEEQRLFDEIVDAQPTADAVPVVHGEWINAYPDIEPNPMFMYGICSQCGFEQSISNKLNYCPNCGAKMRPTSMSVTNGGDHDAPD